MERRIPSDYLLTWLLARLDPLTFGSPTAKAHALATGDPRDKARNALPDLMASFEDVPERNARPRTSTPSTTASAKRGAANRSATLSGDGRLTRARVGSLRSLRFASSHRA